MNEGDGGPPVSPEVDESSEDHEEAVRRTNSSHHRTASSPVLPEMDELEDTDHIG